MGMLHCQFTWSTQITENHTHFQPHGSPYHTISRNCGLRECSLAVCSQPFLASHNLNTALHGTGWWLYINTNQVPIKIMCCIVSVFSWTIVHRCQLSRIRRDQGLIDPKFKGAISPWRDTHDFWWLVPLSHLALSCHNFLNWLEIHTHHTKSAPVVAKLTNSIQTKFFRA